MTIKDIADFVLEHYSPAMCWPEDRLYGWLNWAAAKGFLMLINNDDDLIGLEIARTVGKDQAITENGCEYDPEGECVFLDLVISPNKQVSRALAFAATVRFGKRETVGCIMHGKLKTHSWEKIRKALVTPRKEHGLALNTLTPASA